MILLLVKRQHGKTLGLTVRKLYSSIIEKNERKKRKKDKEEGRKEGRETKETEKGSLCMKIWNCNLIFLVLSCSHW